MQKMPLKVGLELALQTHIDIIENFDTTLVDRLTELSKKHDFLIFEDRKFADIGSFDSLVFTQCQGVDRYQQATR